MTPPRLDEATCASRRRWPQTLFGVSKAPAFPTKKSWRAFSALYRRRRRPPAPPATGARRRRATLTTFYRIRWRRTRRTSRRTPPRMPPTRWPRRYLEKKEKAKISPRHAALPERWRFVDETVDETVDASSTKPSRGLGLIALKERMRRCVEARSRGGRAKSGGCSRGGGDAWRRRARWNAPKETSARRSRSSARRTPSSKPRKPPRGEWTRRMPSPRGSRGWLARRRATSGTP